ncbi:MAG: class I SAM-dependent methyltransferase [Cyanobacteriota bacterium]|nr:class I SAM-dependent methyltransferase [Cyanobacteriota bacterium]
MSEVGSSIQFSEGDVSSGPFVPPSSTSVEPSLKDIHLTQLDKLSDKWELYLDVYHNLFASRRHQPVNLLEIGIQNGGSLECWSRYFPNVSTLVGIDIDINCAGLRFSHPAIHVVVGDASDHDIYRRVGGLAKNYDIIIDDGSHSSPDIIKGFFLYFRLLSPGGLYIAEDLHCSYWKSFEGGLNDRMSSVSFFKRLVDLINRHHWGLSKISTLDALRPFTDHYRIALDLTDLDWLHEIQSVAFEDSMCIVRKRSCRFGEPLLGRRLIGGRAEGVVSGHNDLQYDFCGTPNQDDWYVDFPERELSTESGQLASLEATIASKDQEITSLRHQLNTYQLESHERDCTDSEINRYYHLLRGAQASEAQVKEKLRWNRLMLQQSLRLQSLRQRYEKRMRKILLQVTNSN